MIQGRNKLCKIKTMKFVIICNEITTFLHDASVKTTITQVKVYYIDGISFQMVLRVNDCEVCYSQPSFVSEGIFVLFRSPL